MRSNNTLLVETGLIVCVLVLVILIGNYFLSTVDSKSPLSILSEATEEFELIIDIMKVSK